MLPANDLRAPKRDGPTGACLSDIKDFSAVRTTAGGNIGADAAAAGVQLMVPAPDNTGPADVSNTAQVSSHMRAEHASTAVMHWAT